MKTLIDKLDKTHSLTRSEWVELISAWKDSDLVAYAAKQARALTDSVFGKHIYFRGIIEYTNFCRNDCYYCGLRLSGKDTVRYRLTKEQILSCVDDGYAMGYRTIVLQGGETAYYEAKGARRMVEIVRAIRTQYPDTAITLSMGEMNKDAYEALFEAGADRYLLRHETATKEHYEKLHPHTMSFDNRMNCLRTLKKIGYQTGPGLMVGSPYQTPEHLANDMMFLSDFKPHMVGIGPFQPHHDTPFASFPAGSNELTFFILSLCRIMNPKLLLPATTALDCTHGDGRQRAILAGANVIMPNLSPEGIKQNYLLYDNKPGITQSAAENLAKLRRLVEEIGYTMVVGRGDHPDRAEDKARAA